MAISAVWEKDIPAPHRYASRDGTQGDELGRILPEDPECATHDADRPVIGWPEIFALFYCRFQSLPSTAVRFEGHAGISRGHFCPWVPFQPRTKQINLVLDLGRGLHKATESAIDLREHQCSTNSRI